MDHIDVHVSYLVTIVRGNIATLLSVRVSTRRYHADKIVLGSEREYWVK